MANSLYLDTKTWERIECGPNEQIDAFTSAIYGNLYKNDGQRGKKG
jgi:hypothetical protein